MRIPQITEVQAHIMQRFEAERLDHAGAFQRNTTFDAKRAEIPKPERRITWKTHALFYLQQPDARSSF